MPTVDPAVQLDNALYILKASMIVGTVLYALALMILSLLGSLRWKSPRAKLGWWLIVASGIAQIWAAWHTRLLVRSSAEQIGAWMPVVDHGIAVILLVIGLSLIVFARCDATKSGSMPAGAGGS